MNRIGLKIGKTSKVSSALAVALLVVFATALPARSIAQATGAATIHGHVNNAAGQPVTKGEIRLSTDRSSPAKERKYQYTFPIDQNGDYKGSGIAPGNYVVFVFQGDSEPGLQRERRVRDWRR